MTEDEEFEALEQRLNMKEQEYEQINHPNGVTTWKTKPKEQPKALRLADEIEWIAAGKAGKETAAELRRLYEETERKSDAIQRLWKERDRLHALNQELLEALISIAKNSCCDRCQEAALVAKAALAKAQGASNE